MGYQYTELTEAERNRIHWSKKSILGASKEGFHIFKLQCDDMVVYFSVSLDKPEILRVLFDNDFGEHAASVIIDFITQCCEPGSPRVIIIYGLTYAESEHFPEAFKAYGLESHTGPMCDYAYGGGYIAKRWLPKPNEEVMTWVSKIYKKEKTRFSLLDLGKAFFHLVRS